MLLNDIFIHTPSTPVLLSNPGADGGISVIRESCSEFIFESKGLPIFKTLPSTYPDIKRVKVRFKSSLTPVSEVYDIAFKDETTDNLRGKAVFTYTEVPDVIEEGHDLFYVFPTNGYKYLFSPLIKHSTSEVSTMLETFSATLDDGDSVGLTADLLKYSYQSSNLSEGIDANSEIIFHNMPAFYAVRVMQFPNYTSLIT